jgi:hypothetical protein
MLLDEKCGGKEAVLDLDEHRLETVFGVELAELGGDRAQRGVTRNAPENPGFESLADQPPDRGVRQQPHREADEQESHGYPEWSDRVG